MQWFGEQNLAYILSFAGSQLWFFIQTKKTKHLRENCVDYSVYIGWQVSWNPCSKCGSDSVTFNHTEQYITLPTAGLPTFMIFIDSLTIFRVLLTALAPGVMCQVRLSAFTEIKKSVCSPHGCGEKLENGAQVKPKDLKTNKKCPNCITF